MPIDDIRAKQRADQTQAIKTRLEAGSIVRIGNRLPITGRYEVLDSDGGISNNGVKVYNAQEQYGDRVLAYPRLDGTIALDSEKGSIVRPPTAFPTCPGYLQGQVFNCEEPKKKKKGQIWILFSLNGKMFVGGHQEVPEMIYDSVPPNKPIDTVLGGVNTLQIWGDSLGWEASFSVGGSTTIFASDNGPIQYVSRDRTVDFNSPSYGAQNLGKGLWVANYNIVRSSNYGQTGDDNYTWEMNWRNAILDIDGMASGSGSDLISSTRLRTLGRTTMQSASRLRTAQYPSPYSSKTENYELFAESFPNQPERDSGFEKEIDSCIILFRDRASSLFYRTNFNRFNSTISIGTIDLVLSDRLNDTILFSIPNIQQRSFSNRLLFTMFGATPGDAVQASTDSYKFNSPSVTQVQGRSQLSTHLNALKPYDVKVFSILSRASLIDGVHTIEEVDAWGVPVGALIHDVAAWVP